MYFSFGGHPGFGQISLYLDEESNRPILVAHLGIGDWAYYEIARFIRDGQPIRICKACGKTLELGKRDGSETCNAAFRKAASRKGLNNLGAKKPNMRDRTCKLEKESIPGPTKGQQIQETIGKPKKSSNKKARSRQ